MKISAAAPRTCNMGIWRDADPLRELLNGVTVTKWDRENSREPPLFDASDHGCRSINSSNSNPCLCADILGVWREEISHLQSAVATLMFPKPLLPSALRIGFVMMSL